MNASSYIIIIIIVVVAWSKTVEPLVLWQSLWIAVLTGGSQSHHELDPHMYIEVGLGYDSSSDQVFCFPSRQSPVVMHRLQGLQSSHAMWP